MKADITRDTFDPQRHFRRVLMQQGRVFLDADWNEQSSILLHYLQSLAADVIGPHGGTSDDSFRVSLNESKSAYADLQIARGRYYVQGLLCENLPLGESAGVSLVDQPYPPTKNDPNNPQKLPGFPYLVYLDVWERTITAEEEDEIVEVALEGPDTAARTQLVWQAKVLHLEAGPAADDPIKTFLADTSNYLKFLAALNAVGVRETGSSTLKARAKDRPEKEVEDACILSPDARYRGLENQLYRVEIHGSGPAWDGVDGTKADAATFKWSRENGSVTFAIEEIADKIVTIAHAPHDARHGLEPGDWVEIVDDDYILIGAHEPLLRVESFDRMERKITLSDAPPSDRGHDPLRHPLLRRWDQKVVPNDKDPIALQGVIPALAVKDKDTWLDLEDGIQIQFEVNGNYRTGDYWLIPARVDAIGKTASGEVNTQPGDILWPANQALPPHGVQHWFAPLAVITAASKVTSCRYQIKPIAQPI